MHMRSGGVITGLSSDVTDNIPAVLEQGDRRPSRRSKTHSSRRPWAATAFCTECIRKNTNRRRWALFLLLRARNSGR